MKDKNLKKLVIDAIRTYMVNKMAFTSLDICNYLRSNHSGKDIRMANVSNILRKNILNISTKGTFMYEAAFIKIDSSNCEYAYLYHPYRYNIDNYMSRDQVPLTTL